MHWLVKIRRRFRFLFRKGSADRNMEREMRFHLQLETEAYLKEGMDPREARRRALVGFGGMERFKEQAREERGGRLLDDLIQDVRHASRTLRRQLRFSLAAILTLALGIGGTTSVFSVVNGVLLKPLPYPASNELVAVSVVWEGQTGKDQMAPPDVSDIETLSPSLESLVGYQPVSLTLTGMGDAEIIQAARLSKGLLETFHLPPALGRDIRPDETGVGAGPIAVVSYPFWRDRMGADPDAIGSLIYFSGVGLEVVGVAPEGFDFPMGTEVWIPHRFSSPDSCGRACHTWWTAGRLAPGSDLSSARAEVRTIEENLAADYPDSNARKRFVVESLKSQGTASVRGRLWLIMAAVSLLLFTACANVANLLLMRTYSRRSELAVRAALGGSRTRLDRLVLAETGVLAMSGGVLGVFLAVGGVRVLRQLTAGLVPRMADVAVDGRVLLFSLGAVMVVTVLAGWSPVKLLRSVSPAENLTQQGRGPATRSLGQRARGILIVTQIALSVVLLGGSGLLLRSLGKLYAVDPGFDSDRLLRFNLATRGSLEEVRIFFRSIEEELAALPGVEAAESVVGAPMGTLHITARLRIEGRGEPAPGEETLAGIRAVSPGYLEMMKIRLLQGRLLLPSDDVGGNPVAVVNEAFVRTNFPGQDPTGERVQVLTDQGYGSPTWTIVGVVADIRSEGLDQEPLAEIYVPHGQFGPSVMTVNVRASGDPASLLPAVRGVVRDRDPNIPLRSVETSTEVIRGETAPTRFLMVMGLLFASVALILSMVGLYGVLAYVTAQRTGEIGLRLALGARPGAVVRMFLLKGIGLTGAGLAIGLALSYGSAVGLQSLLYGVRPWDPGALVVVLATLLPSALVAVLIPAWNASRVDPLESLRSE